MLSAVSGIKQKASSLTEGMNIDSCKMQKMFSKYAEKNYVLNNCNLYHETAMQIE